MHYIEQDLYYDGILLTCDCGQAHCLCISSIAGMTLVWETENYLEKHAEFTRLHGP